MEILYEDNHLIAVNKRAGEIVQGDKTGDEPLADKVKAYIKKKYNKPGNVFLGVAHRIDRPVSGVVLFARTSKALERINEMIKNRQISKNYWAVTRNRPPANSATLTHYLVRDTEKNISVAHDREAPNSQKAVLSYRVIGSGEGYFFWEIDLQTGRHHQIRAQLAKIGYPIVGDLKYGYGRPDRDGGIHLHSRSMEFVHPVAKTPVKIVAAPPDDPIWDGFVLKSGITAIN
jgi:23S rRNA pseudouridine1911/1915/1917 synthase